MSDTDLDEDPGEVSHAEEVFFYLVTHVVENPDDVELEITETDDTLSMVARVAKGDIGRVIGKRGRVAQAIRTIVRAAAVRDGKSVEVDFADS
jgi:predicted RNA-binding protein YlqC (UPF0109 family)